MNQEEVVIYPEITKLYKYQSYNINSISSLINKVIWAAKPTTFNDPFDCAVSLIPELERKSLLKLLISHLENKNKKDKKTEAMIELLNKALNDPDKYFEDLQEYNELVESLRNINEEAIKHIGVISLSALDDNMLMWSHYADQHQGFCVEFNRDKHNSLGSKKTLPVRYTHKLPKFRLEDLLGSASKERQEILHSMVLSKALDWSYEQEWRYLNECGNVLVNLNSKITGIIFGARMPQIHRDTLIEVVNKYHTNVSFKEVRLKSDGFGLEVIDYSPKESTSSSKEQKNIEDKLQLIKFDS